VNIVLVVISIHVTTETGSLNYSSNVCCIEKKKERLDD